MLDLRFRIGDIVIALRAGNGRGIFSIEDSYARFLTDAEPDVLLDHFHAEPPGLEDWQPVFDSGGVWRMFRSGGRTAIALHSPSFGPEPYQVAVFNPDYLSGEIYTSRAYFQEPVPFPLRYPLAELLVINLLGQVQDLPLRHGQGRGLLLHACGVKDGGRGLLFSGVSGAGKSTTSHLWQAQPGVLVLSDDRVILRKKGDEFWIYGTPWHGDAHAAAPEAARLEQVFILRHAEHNRADPLRPADLAARLFVRSFPTFWNPAGVAYALQLLAELSTSLPGYELGFLPDSSMVEFVRCLNTN